MNNGENWSAEICRAAEKAIGYKFRDRGLLIKAFTHSSYTNIGGEESYERLEFLGDTLVDFVASEMLYREYPKATEGELTNLRKQYVSKDALTPVSRRMGLMQFVRYSGAGENNLGKKVASDLFEAVTAAIYLDGGLEAAISFVKRHLAFTEIIDYKTRLQEFVAGKEHEKSKVTYQTSKEAPFFSTVTALGVSAQGAGDNKQAAEVAAAKNLLEKLQK